MLKNQIAAQRGCIRIAAILIIALVAFFPTRSEARNRLCAGSSATAKSQFVALPTCPVNKVTGPLCRVIWGGSQVCGTLAEHEAAISNYAAYLNPTAVFLYGVRNDGSYIGFEGDFWHTNSSTSDSCTIVSWTGRNASVLAQCLTRYHLWIKQDVDKGKCDTCLDAGNPINSATGNKFQEEVDYQGRNGLIFKRFYNSSESRNLGIGAGWRHSFQRRLTPNYAGGSPQTALGYADTLRSPDYTTASAACTSGWLAVRSKVVGGANKVATYSGTTCTVPGVTLGVSLSNPAPNQTGWIVERADGRPITFTSSGGNLVGPANVTGRLTAVAGGYQYIENDIVELYDANGVLQSVTDPQGIKQTLTYANGRLDKVTDSFGRTLSFTYNGNGRVDTVKDPADQIFRYAYDANGNLVTVEYPDTAARRYVYGDARFPNALTGLIELTDINDPSTQTFAAWAYDDSGRAFSSTHADGVEETTLTYGTNETSVANAYGAVRTHKFEKFAGRSRLKELVVPCPDCGTTKKQTRTYDANGFLNLLTDVRGYVTDHDFDARGLETQRVEAQGTGRERKITTSWNTNFRVPDVVSEFGAASQSQPIRTTSFGYLSGTALKTTKTVTDIASGEARTTTWGYTSGYSADYVRLLQSIDEPRNEAGVVDLIEYEYDTANKGNPSRITKHMTSGQSHVTQIPDYDAHGNPTRIIDPNGMVTVLTYDAMQRLKTRQIDTSTTLFDYYTNGLLKKITQPDGAYLEYTYNAARQLVRIEDNTLSHIQYGPDKLGNRVTEEIVDPSGTVRFYRKQVFNTIGQLKQIRNRSDELVAEFGYDAAGNRISEASYVDQAEHHDNLTEFDALGRVAKVTAANNSLADRAITEYGYSPLDQLVSVTDPKGIPTTYAVNAFGDVEEQASPDTGTTRYPIYDAAGNRKRQIDAREVQVDYQYDALNRLTVVDYPGTAEDVTYVYDGANYSAGVPNGKGRLTGIIEHGGTSTTTILYDARGTVQQETRVIDGATYTTGYGYDSADRLTSVEYPTGRIVTYERNNIGQVSKVTTTVGTTTTTVAEDITYMPFGGIKRYALANGVIVTRTHDQDYRLEKIKDQGGATVREVNLYYDLRGNIESLEDVGNAASSQAFGYDGLSRLTSADGAYGTRALTYDGVGNRQAETVTPPGSTDAYTYANTKHHLQSLSSGASFTYDAAGAVESTGSLSIVYNSAHRANAITLGGTTVNNIYNAAGQRVRKSVGSEQTTFHYDSGGQLLAETGSGGLFIQREYIWLEGIALAVIADVNRATIVTDNTDAAFSSTGSWSASTAASGYHGGDYLSRAPVGEPSGTQVLDDLDPGTSKTGTWVPATGTPPGYHGLGYQRSGFSLDPSTFTWSLPLIAPGDYRVYVRWVSDPSYSTDARYTVTHASGSQTQSVNQTTGGGSWYLLGTYAFTTTAQISLADPTGGTLIADAVRVIPVTALTATATWSAPEAQSYEVYARWPAAAHHAKRAAYTITHGSGTADLIRDQTGSGGQWNLLGTYTFGSTSQGITLRADPDATTVADAVRFVPAGASVTQTTTAYAHVDHLGTIQKMTDAGQQIVWQASYEPFGKATITKQPYYENPLRFPGQYFDAETGLHQNWNRDYDPTIGRYLQSDPIGLDGGINTYAYGASNPLTMIDPDGLLFIDPTGSMPDDTTGPTRPPKPKECEACEGDDRVVVEIKSTVCRMGDVMCEIAYRQAGIPGPYTPHKRVFSKRCLMTMGMLVKPAGFAASEGAVRVLPRAARAAGASEGTASALGRWAGRLFGWQMGAALLPIVGDQIMNDCECGK